MQHNVVPGRAQLRMAMPRSASGGQRWSSRHTPPTPQRGAWVLTHRTPT